MVGKKTYLDFGVAMDNLRKKAEVSFDTMSFSIGIAQSYLWGLANRRKANLPKDELMKKIAKYFRIEPEYFYEWRLKRVLDHIDSNRKFLDTVERAAKKYVPAEVEEDEEEELVTKKGKYKKYHKSNLINLEEYRRKHKK